MKSKRILIDKYNLTNLHLNINDTKSYYAIIWEELRLARDRFFINIFNEHRYYNLKPNMNDNIWRKVKNGEMPLPEIIENINDNKTYYKLLTKEELEIILFIDCL